MKAKILIVDDDPDILDAFTMILESRGYQVSTARNGLECLATLKAEAPDLVILDLVMPRMDGFAVCKELRRPEWSRYREIPVLVLTAVREEASRRHFELETGADLDVEDYLEKPTPPDVLLERVAKLVKKKQTV